jgi:SCY1-like protein 1
MADSVIPPTTAAEPNKSDARIGTSNDKSWAGWAISSFTNKIAAADGEIESTAGTKPAEADIQRPASVPRPAKSSPSTQLGLPKETPRPTAHPLSRSQSDRPVPIGHEEQPEDEGDDVFDAWGAMDDDENDDDPFTAAVASPNPNPSSPDPSAKAPAVPYDDGGEPDFAGWLAAKNSTKAKNPLPKGLAKSASTTSAPTRSTVTKPKTVAPKKIDTKPKDEDVDDGWGDAWD